MTPAVDTSSRTRFAPLDTQFTLFAMRVPFCVLPFLVAGIATDWQIWKLLAGLALVLTLAGCLRTSLTFDHQTVVVRNLFRTHQAPWTEVVAIEPSNRSQKPDDTLAIVTRDRRIRVLITLGPGRQGAKLDDALHSVLGKRAADRIISFRPPGNPRPWSRTSSQWRPRR